MISVITFFISPYHLHALCFLPLTASEQLWQRAIKKNNWTALRCCRLRMTVFPHMLHFYRTPFKKQMIKHRRRTLAETYTGGTKINQCCLWLLERLHNCCEYAHHLECNIQDERTENWLIKRKPGISQFDIFVCMWPVITLTGPPMVSLCLSEWAPEHPQPAITGISKIESWFKWFVAMINIDASDPLSLSSLSHAYRVGQNSIAFTKSALHWIDGRVFLKY